VLNRRLAGNYSWNGNEINVLFRNDGNDRFSDVGFISGSGLKEDSRSFVLGDFDEDGDYDVVTNSLDAKSTYLENRIGQKKHWLGVKLTGTKSNRDGVGARMWVEAGETTQMREFHVGYSYLSQGQGFETIFGLGENDLVKQLRIRWPSGTEDVLRNVRADRVVTVVEGKHPAPELQEFLANP
jgi:hypothetical protein